MVSFVWALADLVIHESDKNQVSNRKSWIQILNLETNDQKSTVDDPIMI